MSLPWVLILSLQNSYSMELRFKRKTILSYMLEILPAITTLGRCKQRKFKGSVSSRPAEMNEIGQTAFL